MVDSTCPAATVTSSSLTITGSITYNADLTYTQTGAISGTVVVTEPTSCFTQAGVTPTCDDINKAFQDNNQDPSLNLHCTGTSTCTCTETFTNEDSSETGTYTTTTAGLLSQTTDGDTTADESDYCVKGTTMTQSPHSGSMMMGGSVSGTITFTKS
jgi:hypothetical protein